MKWLEVFQTLWPVAVTITPLVVWAGFIWLSTKFVTKQEGEKDGAALHIEVARIDDLCDRMILVEAQVDSIQQNSESRPTRADLSSDIRSLVERVSGLEASMDGVQRGVTTSNNYLHTLIEQGLRK